MTTPPNFADFATADLVTLTTNLKKEKGRVDDPAAIGRVAAWLAAREDGWYEPDTGVLVMKLRLSFSREGKPLGNVGIGKKYLTAHRHGGFRQRPIEPGEDTEIFDLLGVPDPRP